MAKPANVYSEDRGHSSPLDVYEIVLCPIFIAVIYECYTSSIDALLLRSMLCPVSLWSLYVVMYSYEGLGTGVL